jgi:hypothetical protein
MITVAALTVSGTIGLMFTTLLSPVKFWILIVMGVYFSLHFLFDVFAIDKDIKFLLRRLHDVSK